jgi:branched-subunit amino acid aminotransferase/4-amino-4-deoxychorismate lyase
MDEPIAYLSGKVIPARELSVSPHDTGFMLGVTVAEQLRTFGGQLFAWEQHFTRLTRSLEIIGILDLLEPASFHQTVDEITQHNFQLIDPAADLGVTIFVTPGLYATYAPHAENSPTVAVHTYPLPFALWADKYRGGQRCAITSVAQISPDSWPPQLKCRSRAHYFLADQEVKRTDPAARAIFLDQHGDVNEATTANVVAYFEHEGIVSPPLSSILPGVSLQFVAELAEALSIPFSFRGLRVDELKSADEILLTSTPFCVLPVASIDGHACRIGKVSTKLLSAWSARVGLDIMAQACTHSESPS